MILLYISTTDEKQAEDISDFLLEDRLILDALMFKGERKVRANDAAISRTLHFVVECRTRALLYDKISKELEKRYSSAMPLLYSVPIVITDWNQSIELTEDVD